MPGPKILFVDDDRATREGYAAYLDINGYEVITTGSGSEALELAVNSSPAVIVLDLGLKDLDGWEVARRLRSDSRVMHVPIIAFTGAGLTHERVSAMRAGCDRVVTKPCEPGALLDAIDRCTNPSGPAA